MHLNLHQTDKGLSLRISTLYITSFPVECQIRYVKLESLLGIFLSYIGFKKNIFARVYENRFSYRGNQYFLRLIRNCIIIQLIHRIPVTFVLKPKHFLIPEISTYIVYLL